jgi:hypothetical protein
LQQQQTVFPGMTLLILGKLQRNQAQARTLVLGLGTLVFVLFAS